MDDVSLSALIADIGGGIIIDPELLEGCNVAAHDLDDMDSDQAADVASHVFETLFETKAIHRSGYPSSLHDGSWSGVVNGFPFVIQRDEVGDLHVSFSTEKSV